MAQDPEVRYTKAEKAVASFNLAVNRIVAKGAHPEADFIPIVAWGQLAEICGNHLVKGQRILVSGRLQIRPYEKDGQKRRVAEVIAQNIEFLDKKATGEQKASAAEEFNGEEIPF